MDGVKRYIPKPTGMMHSAWQALKRDLSIRKALDAFLVEKEKEDAKKLKEQRRAAELRARLKFILKEKEEARFFGYGNQSDLKVAKRVNSLCITNKGGGVVANTLNRKVTASKKAPITSSELCPAACPALEQTAKKAPTTSPELCPVVAQTGKEQDSAKGLNYYSSYKNYLAKFEKENHGSFQKEEETVIPHHDVLKPLPGPQFVENVANIEDAPHPEDTIFKALQHQVNEANAYFTDKGVEPGEEVELLSIGEEEADVCEKKEEIKPDDPESEHELSVNNDINEVVVYKGINITIEKAHPRGLPRKQMSYMERINAWHERNDQDEEERWKRNLEKLVEYDILLKMRRMLKQEQALDKLAKKNAKKVSAERNAKNAKKPVQDNTYTPSWM